MVRHLPTTHPPVKGCVNLAPVKEVMALDFSDWETDEHDFVITIDYWATFTSEDWNFIRDVSPEGRHTPASFLPIRLQRWFNETELKGVWFYDIKNMKFPASKSSAVYMGKGVQPHQRCYRLFFQYAEDAVLFRLRWEGEQE